MEKIDKLAIEVEHLPNSQNPASQTPKGKASYENRGMRGNRSEQQDGNRFRHFNKSECSKCQGTGHSNHTCKWNGEGRVNPGVKCHL
jgi:hypothetical protein